MTTVNTRSRRRSAAPVPRATTNGLARAAKRLGYDLIDPAMVVFITNDPGERGVDTAVSVCAAAGRYEVRAEIGTREEHLAHASDATLALDYAEEKVRFLDLAPFTP